MDQHALPVPGRVDRTLDQGRLTPLPSHVARMPAARRRIWEAGLRTGIADPEAVCLRGSDAEERREQEQHRERAAKAAREAVVRQRQRDAAERLARHADERDQERAAHQRAAARALLRKGRDIGRAGASRFCHARLLTICRPVLSEVAAKHGLKVEELLGRSRLGIIVRARHEAMCRLKIEAKLSFPEIGLRFGRHHTTVLSGVRAHVRRYGLPMPRCGEQP